jgi:hypothetical protein
MAQPVDAEMAIDSVMVKGEFIDIDSSREDKLLGYG